MPDETKSRRTYFYHFCPCTSMSYFSRTCSKTVRNLTHENLDSQRTKDLPQLPTGLSPPFPVINRMFQKAIAIYNESGRFQQAGKMLQEVGEIYEAEGLTGDAVDALQQAAEYLAVSITHFFLFSCLACRTTRSSSQPHLNYFTRTDARVGSLICPLSDLEGGLWVGFRIWSSFFFGLRQVAVPSQTADISFLEFAGCCVCQV